MVILNLAQINPTLEKAKVDELVMKIRVDNNDYV